LVLRGRCPSHFRRTHTSGVLTLPAYSCAARPHTASILTRRWYSRFQCTHAPLILTLPAYLRAARTHTSVLLVRRSYLYFWGTYVPLVLTCLLWVRCPCGIRHARCALRGVRTHILCVILSAFSHTLRRLVVLVVSVTPSVVLSQSSHTPCMGSLFSLGLVVTVPVHR